MGVGGPAVSTLETATLRVGINVVAAQNPKLGQALMYVSGSWGQGVEGWVQNAVGSYTQYEIQGELERVAARLGLSLEEFNLFLALNSKVGLKIAGTTYDSGTGTIEGFASRRKLAGVGVL